MLSGEQKREQKRLASLTAWLERPLPRFDPEKTRCEATAFYTWGQWYAQQIADDLGSSVRSPIARYLDEEICVDTLIAKIQRASAGGLM